MIKHFKPYELVDQDTYEQYGDQCMEFFNPILLISIDGMWEFFNSLEPCSIIVNNWYWGGELQWRGLRTIEKAKALGASKSEHRYEPNVHLVNAIDCHITKLKTRKRIPAIEARQIMQDNKNHFLLMNITRMEDIVTWLHIDCKPLRQGQERIYLFKG